MGSYLTIVNNTQDAWLCKVGSDSNALRWSTVGAGVVAAAAGIIATAGMVAPLVAAMSGKGILTIFSVPAAAMTASAATVTTPATVVGFSTGFGIAIAHGIAKTLDENGYDTINAGESKQYGKMTLSLWQQATCVRTTIIETKVQVDTLLMRPIFSGSTINSNRKYEIQSWIDKKGMTTELIEGDTRPKPDHLEEYKKSNDMYIPTSDTTPRLDCLLICIMT